MTEETKYKTEETGSKKSVKEKKQRKLIIIIGIVFAFIAIVAGGAYLYVSSKMVYIDQSVISGDLINLAPQSSGVLNQIFVNVGDSVFQNESVAQVGNELVKAKANGIIVSIDQNIGQIVNPQSGGYAAQMIDPSSLRVVGHIDENKGLSKIKVGDAATFTVDAFGSKTYKGIVDEISETSRASDIVFNVSTERPTNEFDVKIRFDTTKYPELKNGMSARIWVYVN